MAGAGAGRLERKSLGLGARCARLQWPFVALVSSLAAIGVGMLYSVAGGSMEPWAAVHGQRFAVGLALFFAAAMVDIRLWMRLAVPLYVAVIVALVGVEAAGIVGGGARRWIAAGDYQLQPSEAMKLALILALARYYQAVDPKTVSWPSRLIAPLALIAVPAALVVRQPDLGTAALICAGGAAVMLAAGVHWLYFALAGVAAAASAPFVWQSLHDYQKARILTFLDPERDPLGAGYHIIQSKIALGSGGLFGKGFVRGTQSQLDFVPEKHTDFIFAMIGEEFGFLGAVAVIGLFAAVVLLGLAIAAGAQSRFGRLACAGVAAMVFLYAFINVGMVAGLVPVVGVPLPLISYGGTAMATLMVGFGVMMSADIDRDIAMPRPLARRRRRGPR